MDEKEPPEPASLLPKIVCVTTLAGCTETSGDAATMDTDPRPYSCPVCQKCFASRNYLTMHMRWLHDGVETAAANANTRADIIALPSSPSTTLPPTAVLLPSIGSVTTLTDSNETSGDTAIQDSDPGFPDSTIATSAKQRAKAGHTSDKLHPCPVCGRRFAHKYQVAKHQAVHTGEKQHACSKCGERFVWRKALVQHERTHTGEQPFQCSDCSVTFASSDRLKNHILTHTGERPHECDVCGMRFKLKKTLVGHRHTHTSEMHYTCKQCPAAFARSDTLKDHVLTHTGERTHECDVCGKRFKLKSTLVGHRRTHTSEMQYTCEQCPAAFRRNETLKKHMQLHECGVDAYHCPICKRAFSFSPKLTLHMRLMHNGGRLRVMGNDCNATPSPPSSHSSTLLPVNIKTEDCGDLSDIDELITGDVYL